MAEKMKKRKPVNPPLAMRAKLIYNLRQSGVPDTAAAAFADTTLGTPERRQTNIRQMIIQRLRELADRLRGKKKKKPQKKSPASPDTLRTNIK